MESPSNGMESPLEQMSQLQAEIQDLRAENQQLRSDHAKAIAKLEEQIAVEKRYEESQSRFETIFYQSKLGNKIIAPDLRIIQINPILAKMLGYSAEEIVGTRIVAFAHPDFLHHWHELQENLWTKQIPSFQIETSLIRKDGSSFWCQVTSILFYDQGTTLGYTIVEDISQRKALESELQKMYEYQETIMYMVTHDLKSPIHVIKSLSGLLEKNIVQLLQAEREKKDRLLSFVGMISETCDKANIILDDLLFIGELKARQEFERTDLKNFITSQLPTLGVEAQKKGIALHFHCTEESVYARINANKLMRLLENLLSNAVKFTHTGGQVTISLQSQGQRVRLRVSDTGIGIPQQLQASLFTMFTKAARKGTKGENTTGLGLYIVRQIVEMHQGYIRVESQENAGTTFHIELPESPLI
jgi:two-component system sensor histidine kinase VicK